MRVDPNLMLRGATWSLRIAVPKTLRELRVQADQAAGSREVWRSLGTGDYRLARQKATEIKARLLREFAEEAAELERRVKLAPRVVPSSHQIQQAVFAFKKRERGELLRERLESLPTGKQVRDAEERLAALDATPLRADETPWSRLVKCIELAGPSKRQEWLTERRQVLRDELAAHIKDNEFALVDWAIWDIADQNRFEIEPEGREYRILGTLLLRAWIQELDSAESVALDLDVTSTMEQLLPVDDQVPSASEATLPATAQVRTEKDGASYLDLLKQFDTYLDEQKRELSASAVLDHRRVIQQLVEVSGAKDARAIRKAHLSAYKRKLQKMPPNAGRDHPGKTMDEVIASLAEGAARLKPKTVNSKLSILSAFGKWLAKTTDEIDAANYATALLPVAGTSEKMKEFSDDEVCTIFHSLAFTGCAGERRQGEPGSYRIRDYRFWLPLMAAFTGCRLNELTQLRNGDVQERDGILVLSITDAGEGQSLKTRQSKRLVPVHSALIRVGFKERWQAAKDKGEEFFFYDAPVDRQGRRSEMPGKLFRRLLTRLGIKDAGSRGGMHRFRHTVVEKLRGARLFDHQIAPLVGHWASLAPMTQAYGSSQHMTVEQRHEAIESICYEGLDLDRLAKL